MHYDDPLTLQQSVLLNILEVNADTEFGRAHGFNAIVKGISPFAERVPIRSYEEHLPYIERALNGDAEVLTADAPDWVATTSGTTGSTKYLPYSNYAVREIHLKGSWMSLACLYAKDSDVQVFSSKNLLIGGAFKGVHQPSGLPQGDISAIIIRSIPKVMRSFYIPDIDLATAEGYEDKIERIAHLAAAEPGINVLGGVPTWNLPLYRRILDIHGGDNMLDVWPEARVFKHGGVNFAPYRRQFEELFPSDNFIFQEIYNATEGFFGVQDRDDLRSILLILNAGVYYEFIPWQTYYSETKTAIPLAEVSTGITYVMLITTVAGLYRYPMGDLIAFTEVDPYRIVILGRTQEYINAFGEDLLRSEAEGALLEACQTTNAVVREFTVAPRYAGLGQIGGHHWIVEFERPPEDEDRFNDLLDDALQSANYNYKAKRSTKYGIDRQLLTVAPRGLFLDYLRRRGKQGGQHKVPRLLNHRRLLEELLTTINGGS